MIYGYMIHSIAKKYGIGKPAAGSHREFDFWEMIAFENLDSKRDEYIIKQRQE